MNKLCAENKECESTYSDLSIAAGADDSLGGDDGMDGSYGSLHVARGHSKSSPAIFGARRADVTSFRESSVVAEFSSSEERVITL